MKTRNAALVLAAVSLVVTGLAVNGCSGDDGPTYPGGGGGGSGTLFNSGSLTAPATFRHTFATAGAVGYHCTFHAAMGMRGTVTVVNGGADSAVVTASGMAFAPTAVSIKPGGFVRWNVTGGTHTVTSDN